MSVRPKLPTDRLAVCISWRSSSPTSLRTTLTVVVRCADKYCSPTRTAIQSGRNPYHVNPLNAAPEIYNPADPVSGMAAMPRNMTGMAMKMAAAGYKTHMFGKWGGRRRSVLPMLLPPAAHKTCAFRC